MRFILVSGRPSDIAALGRLTYDTNSYSSPPWIVAGKMFAVVNCPTDDAAQYQTDRYSSAMLWARLYDSHQAAREGHKELVF